MKPHPPTDAEVEAALRYGYQSFNPMLRDLLRCRRALRRIHRVTDDSLARRIAAEAIGKGAR